MIRRIGYGLLSLVGILPLAMMLALDAPSLDGYWVRVVFVFALIGGLAVIIAGLWFTLWCLQRAGGWDFMP